MNEILHTNCGKLSITLVPNYYYLKLCKQTQQQQTLINKDKQLNFFYFTTLLFCFLSLTLSTIFNRYYLVFIRL